MTTEKARRAVSALASLMLLFVITSASRVQARAGPKAEVMPVPTPTASATVTPSATPTSTPIPTITPTATAIPAATLDPVTEITTAYVIERVMIWRAEVERIKEWEGFDLDVALVLSVMAAESGGDWTVISYAGACGLMQVIPQPWHELSYNAICKSNVGNLYMGMHILTWSLDLAESEGFDIRFGLGFYNCSYDAVLNDRCGDHGGLNYADKILDFWYPRIKAAIGEDMD